MYFGDMFSNINGGKGIAPALQQAWQQQLQKPSAQQAQQPSAALQGSVQQPTGSSPIQQAQPTISNDSTNSTGLSTYGMNNGTTTGGSTPPPDDYISNLLKNIGSTSQIWGNNGGF